MSFSHQFTESQSHFCVYFFLLRFIKNSKISTKMHEKWRHSNLNGFDIKMTVKTFEYFTFQKKVMPLIFLNSGSLPNNQHRQFSRHRVELGFISFADYMVDT